MVLLIVRGPKLDEIVGTKLLNDRNGRRQLIVVFVDVSSLLLLPKVATAGKAFGWFIYSVAS